MVERTRSQSVRVEIGIEHVGETFRNAFAETIERGRCLAWAPGELPSEPDFDVLVVDSRASADLVERACPQASILRWGCPESTGGGARWDGWISRELSAPAAADVLIEMLDARLLGRNHGPAKTLRPNHRLH